MTEEPKKSRAFEFSLLIIIVVGLIVSVILYIDSRSRNAHREETFRCMRSLSLALFGFEDEYGSYPNQNTAVIITKNDPSHGYDLSGNSSNAHFRQLFAAGITEAEMLFYAKIKNAIKPDGNLSHGEALKKGECGLAYISGLSSTDKPNTPIVLTPIIPGTNKFDPRPFNGKALVLSIDYAVSTYEIQKDGTIHDKDGNLLSPDHPIWNGKTPTIHYPE